MISNRRHLLFWILILFFFSYGCAAPKQVMIHPTTKQQINCSSWGFGVIGAPAALVTYSQCKDKYTALGYIPIEDFEKKETPKLIQSESSPPCPKPIWNEGYEWKYLSNGKTAFIRVVRKETYNNAAVYRVTNDKGRVLLLNDDLNLVATLKAEGDIENEFMPPNRVYEWPLKVGNKWIASGVMKTPTGKINLSTHFEVKDYGKIKTQAGEYNVFYIIGNSDSGARVMEIWYSPVIKYRIKSIFYTQTGLVTEEILEYAHPASTGEKIEDTNIEKKLQSLNDLRKKGLITEEEYAKKKEKILDQI
jgi:hypothetical protein